MHINTAQSALRLVDQLMNIVSNFVFHCNNCDANRVFVKFRESANQHGCRANWTGSLNAKFTL